MDGYQYGYYPLSSEGFYTLLIACEHAHFFSPNNFWGQPQLTCEMHPLTADVISWSVFPIVWLAQGNHTEQRRKIFSYSLKAAGVFFWGGGGSTLHILIKPGPFCVFSWEIKIVTLSMGLRTYLDKRNQVFLIQLMLSVPNRAAQ